MGRRCAARRGPGEMDGIEAESGWDPGLWTGSGKERRGCLLGSDATFRSFVEVRAVLKPSLEQIHNEPLCDPLYCAGATKDFSYKALQASRWEKELVEYSRRLEEVTVVGRAGIRSGRVECFWSLFVPHRVFLYLASTRIISRLSTRRRFRILTGYRLHNGADVHYLDASGFQGDVLLLQEGLLQGVLLGPACLPGRGAGEGAAQGRELQGRAGRVRAQQRPQIFFVCFFRGARLPGTTRFLRSSREVRSG